MVQLSLDAAPGASDLDVDRSPIKVPLTLPKSQLAMHSSLKDAIADVKEWTKEASIDLGEHCGSVTTMDLELFLVQNEDPRLSPLAQQERPLAANQRTDSEKGVQAGIVLRHLSKQCCRIDASRDEQDRQRFRDAPFVQKLGESCPVRAPGLRHDQDKVRFPGRQHRQAVIAVRDSFIGQAAQSDGGVDRQRQGAVRFQHQNPARAFSGHGGHVRS